MSDRRFVCVAGRCFLCIMVSVLLIVLTLSIALIGLGIPAGHKPTTIVEGLAIVYTKWVVPLLVTGGEILKEFSPWGFIFVIGLSVVLWGPIWIRQTLTSSRLEFGSFKFDPSRPSEFQQELSATTRIVDRTNKEIGEAYLAARTFASGLRDKHNIAALVAALAIRTSEKIGPKCPDDSRLTLYVSDFLFADRLFQFTEYYDGLHPVWMTPT